MTKRLRALIFVILTVLMCFAFALVLTVSGMGTQARADETDGNATPVAIYVLGANDVVDTENGYDIIAATDTTPITYKYSSHSAGWNAAITRSTVLAEDGNKNLIKVILAADWNATITNDTSGSPSNSSFGSGVGFANGAISVVAKANILLDLNNHNIDRKLVEINKVQTYGMVFWVEGKLEVCDSVTGEGKITGGYSTNGGGMRVQSTGSVTLKSGKIYGNKTNTNNGGVVNYGRFEMYGGEISGNFSAATNNVWGVGMYNRNVFIMHGGKITENYCHVENTTIQQVFGCGIYTTGRFDMLGGEISYNEIRGKKNFSIGAGVGLGGQSVFTMRGGSIDHNTIYSTDSGSGGSAIYMQSGTAVITGDAKIQYNKSVGENKGTQSEGTIDCAQGTQLEIDGNADISFNKILRLVDGKEVLQSMATATNSISYGSAVSCNNAILKIKGGSIHSNIGGQSTIELTNNANVCEISGGIITNNLASSKWGAMHYNAGSNVTISGNPQIYDNYAIQSDISGLTAVMYTYDGNEEFDLTEANGGTAVTAYPSNLRNNDNGSAANKHEEFDLRIGKMEEGANVYINLNTRQEGFSVAADAANGVISYAENNKVEGVFRTANSVGEEVKYSYPIDPEKFFHADSGNVIIVNVRGQLVELASKTAPQFKTIYGGADAIAESINGYGHVAEYAIGNSLTNSVEYGGAPKDAVVEKDGATAAETSNAGIYTVTATLATTTMYDKTTTNYVNIQYTVVVKPKLLTADNTQATVTGTYTFSGEAKTPTYTLKDGEYTLVSDMDYVPTLANNVNAGDKAEIIASYKDNYQGEVTYYFTIANLPDTYSVTWQYRKEAEWLDMPENRSPFTYDTTDHSYSVRAKLTAGGKEEYVYAASDDNQLNTTNMRLVFAGTFEGGAVSALLNAAQYSIEIIGSSNYTFNENDRISAVTVLPRSLDLSREDFTDYTGVGDENRLWLLQLNGGATAQLRDRTTYYDPGAEFGEEYGAKVTEGTLYNAYVRYTGAEHSIILNENYRIRNTTLAAYMESGIRNIEYNSSNAATGEADKVNKIVTTVRINLNGNWATDDSGAQYIEFEKEWYIVTINNALRTIEGDVNTAIENYRFGDTVYAMPFRPEHGDGAILTLSKSANVVTRFAAVFSGDALRSSVDYYEVKDESGNYVADTTKPIRTENYYSALLSDLSAGNYSLNVYVPKYSATQNHSHWWGGTESESVDVVFYPISRTYLFTVAPYEISSANTGLGDSEKDLTVAFTNGAHVDYNGSYNNVPALTVTFKGALLEEGVDYKLSSSDKDVTEGATLVLTGMNNFSAFVEFEDAFEIQQATNTWEGLPSIMYWSFGGFDKNVNVIRAVPKFGSDDARSILFSVAADAQGENIVDGLSDFYLTDGVVSDEIATLLANKLEVGVDYYLCARFDSTSDNYTNIAYNSVPFRVFRANNYWEETPSIASWTEGSYDGTRNAIALKARFGEATFVVTDANGKAVDDLASLVPGRYRLVASVAGTKNYTELTPYTFDFEVFEKPGLPWWATTLIAVGALTVAAIIILILWKKGVFQILTGKIVLAIRTRATIDATIAAVRAAKRSEQAKKSVAEAEARDAAEARAQARKEAAEAERQKPIEERAAVLESKAQETSERADRMKARADKMKARVERMKKQAQIPEAAATETPEATENTDDKPEE